MEQLVGRIREQRLLRDLADSGRPEFVVVYGRRRIGKTFLVRRTFAGRMAFCHAGIAKAPKSVQLKAFRKSLSDSGLEDRPVPADWFEAFSQLEELLKRKRGRKIVFLDELPWMDTHASRFVSALEHFWNGWASPRSDVCLVACGSATSWILDKVVRSKGGLHNRVTRQIALEPFTLAECERFCAERGIEPGRKELAEAYMAFGGVPYYWGLLERGKSLAQNFDALFFAKNGELRGEFDRLYSSLFGSEDHRRIVEALGTRRSGMSRNDLAKAAGLENNGTFTRHLGELEQCGFTRRIPEFGKTAKNARYQLVDCFTLFHFRFLTGRDGGDRRFWTHTVDSHAHSTWAGIAFELVCLLHVEQIKRALGVSGVHTEVGSWMFPGENGKPGAQIDLLIDRADAVVNLCEMKFSDGPFPIDKAYADALANKKAVFKRETGTRKGVHVTLVTTEGVSPGKHAGIVQSQVVLDDLFADE